MKGVLDSGYTVSRAEVDRNGHITIVPGPPISAVGKPGEEPPGTPKPLITLKYLFENFGTISAIMLAIGLGGAVTFLFSYLSVFDWRLMWLMDYTDILKVGLFLIGVCSGLLYAVLQPIVLNIEDLLKGKRVWAYIWLSGIGVAAISALVYTFLYHRPAISLFLDISLVVFLIAIAYRIYMYILNPYITYNSLIWDAIGILYAIIISGQAMAYSVPETEDTYYIAAKLGNLTNAKIVMVSTTYLILLLDEHIVTLPAADLISITKDVKA